MEVTIDGQRGFVFEEEPADLLAAAGMISDALRARGRAVLSIGLDGAGVTPEKIVAALEGRSPESVQVLSVTSEEIAKLVNDCLAELESALPELPQICHQLAEVFQGERPDSGYEPFEQLANIWKTIKEHELQVIGALDLEVERLNVDGMPIEQLHAELNQYIEEAADALKTGDCVLLGDLLEYELAPRAEAEAAIVALLRSYASS